MRTHALAASALLALQAAGLATLAGPPEPDVPALAAALDAIDTRHIRADLSLIASDAMEGRDSPSAGLRATARFLENRLRRMGFEPGAPEGYLYAYTLAWRQLDQHESALVVLRDGEEPRRLAFGVDYFLGPTDLADLAVRGGLVSVGEGGEAEVERCALGGCWAVCRRSDTPLRRVETRVQGAGAVGLIVTPGPKDKGMPFAERFAGTTQVLREGALGAHARDVFPKVYLAERTSSELFGGPAGDPGVLPAAGTALGMVVEEHRLLSPPGGRGRLENVCGFWRGSDPLLAHEVLIVSAHYDHEGVRGGQIYNGADDNGSGTSALLALAEALVRYGPMRRSVLLMWVSAEEKGLLGSKAWTERPWLPEGCYPVCDINIDMVGRNDPDELLITPTRRLGAEYNGLARLAEELAPLEGFTDLRSADEYWRRSDHMNFADQLGLPVTFLFADVHPDYHRPSDTVEKIDFDKVRRVARLVLRMLDRLQTDQLELQRQAVPDAEAFRERVLRGRSEEVLDATWSLLERARVLQGAYPEGLGTLFEDGPPRDAWGHPLAYRPPQAAGEPPYLASLGADGRPGGVGAAEDVAFEPAPR